MATLTIDIDGNDRLALEIDGEMRPIAEAANALYVLASKVAQRGCIPCPVPQSDCDSRNVDYPQCIERIMGWAFGEAKRRKAAEDHGEVDCDA